MAYKYFSKMSCFLKRQRGFLYVDWIIIPQSFLCTLWKVCRTRTLFGILKYYFGLRTRKHAGPIDFSLSTFFLNAILFHHPLTAAKPHSCWIQESASCRYKHILAFHRYSCFIVSMQEVHVHPVSQQDKFRGA